MEVVAVVEDQFVRRPRYRRIRSRSAATAAETAEGPSCVGVWVEVSDLPESRPSALASAPADGGGGGGGGLVQMLLVALSFLAPSLISPSRPS